jgi:hypothetical protein
VKGTRVDKFFLFFEQGWKTWFLTLVGLTYVKGTSVRKKDAKEVRKRRIPWLTFRNQFGAKSINKRFKQSSNKRSPQNMEFDAKGITKRNQKRCPNSLKINAKTCNEKDQENHQKSCFSEW